MTGDGSASSSKQRGLHPETVDGHGAEGAPIVIDLGKKRRKQVKQLRQGKPGKLLHEVRAAIEALQAQNAIAPDAQTVIVVVREKRRDGGDLFRF
jgi:hypothetical protein